MDRPGLFIGSMSPEAAPTNEVAMRLMLESLGHHLRSCPTGEIEDHKEWLADALDQDAAACNMRCLKKTRWSTWGYPGLPVYAPRHGQPPDPSKLCLLHIRRAQTNWPVLDRLKTELGLENVKYQLNIPSPFDMTWFGFGGSTKVLDAFIEAIRLRIEEVATLIGLDNLLVQLETPLSNVLVNLANMGPMSTDKVVKRVVAVHKRTVANWPKGLEKGVHLCNGRLRGKAIFAKLRLAQIKPMAKLAVALAHDLDLDYIHVPLVASGLPPRKPGRYYQDLQIMSGLPGKTQVYAGLVYASGSLEKQIELLHHVEKLVGRTVGVAATCGLAVESADKTFHLIERMNRLAVA